MRRVAGATLSGRLAVTGATGAAVAGASSVARTTSRPSSPTLSYRSATSGASARSSADCNAAGHATPERASARVRGFDVNRFTSVSLDVTFGYGNSPVSMLKSTSPREYTSVRWSSFSPASCSGLMYSGVPNETPAVVTVCEPAPSRCTVFAIPKSTTFTQSVPSRWRATITFSGLRSRWTMPRWCAAKSASATCLAICAARRGGGGPSRAITASSVSPSTNSIAR